MTVPTPAPDTRPSPELAEAARAYARKARERDRLHVGTIGDRIERAAYDAYIAAATPVPCVMTRALPFDFAQCETHDSTFPLGQECRFKDRDPADVYFDEAEEQRGRAVRAEAMLEAVDYLLEPIQTRADLKAGWNMLRGQLRGALHPDEAAAPDASSSTRPVLVEIPEAIAAQLASNHRTNGGLVHAGGRTRARCEPFERFVDLAVGQRVQFHAPARRWWTVEAVSADGDVVVLTRQNRDFGRDDGHYTIIVWSEGRRGPHGSYGYGAETREDCEKIARDFDGDVTLALSERRAIYLDIAKIEARA